MPRKATPSFSERQLSKGELRKLNALRKSLGDDIADKAFSEWYEKSRHGEAGAEDKYAEILAGALQPLIKSNKLRIPRGGYLVRRGRGRVIVERARDLE